MSFSTRSSNADFPDHTHDTVATPPTAAGGGSTTRAGPAGGGGRTGDGGCRALRSPPQLPWITHTLERHGERGGKTVSLGQVNRVGRRWILTANSRERLATLESLVRAEALVAREISRRAERLGGEPPSDGRKVRTLVVDNNVVPAADDDILRFTQESWVDTTVNSLGMTPAKRPEPVAMSAPTRRHPRRHAVVQRPQPRPRRPTHHGRRMGPKGARDSDLNDARLQAAVGDGEYR
jgi:hypothetical protein